MSLLLLCLKIFFIRILDVSLGTIRTIITVKGKNVTASIVGFFEVLIWFLVVREALNTTNDSLFIAISYALGFAAGTLIGGYLSNKFIRTSLSVQIVVKDASIGNKIRKSGYAVSIIDIKGQDELTGKYMLFIEITNKNFDHLKKLVHSLDKNAFIVVNETKYVQNGFIK